MLQLNILVKISLPILLVLLEWLTKFDSKLLIVKTLQTFGDFCEQTSFMRLWFKPLRQIVDLFVLILNLILQVLNLFILIRVPMFLLFYLFLILLVQQWYLLLVFGDQVSLLFPFVQVSLPLLEHLFCLSELLCGVGQVFLALLHLFFFFLLELLS